MAPVTDSAECPVRRRVLPRVVAGLLTCGLLATDPAHARSAGERMFELRIESGGVAGGPDTVRVTQGDVVELRWSADEPVEVHLHGYVRRLRVAPNAPATLRFEARAMGRFPITRHATDGHGHETLLYLETYPR